MDVFGLIGRKPGQEKFQGVCLAVRTTLFLMKWEWKNKRGRIQAFVFSVA